MFAIDDLAAVPLVGDILRDIGAEYPRIEASRQVHELRRRLITRMIEDVIAQTRRRVAELGIESPQGVRAAAAPVVTFSPAMAQADRAIKDFLYPRLYRHARIMRIMGDAERVVRELFAHFVEHPGDMPAEWLQGLDPQDKAGRALRIADFIAGMTDRYAMIEHGRLFGSTPELR
jgi:dGTPase